MKMLRMLIALLAMAATHAAAIIPENGWWWASNEGGRGFNIEVQNNLVFFAAFAYDGAGSPTWITAGGAMTSDRDFTADLTRYTAGQCFGCDYVQPTAVPAGTLTLRFTSSQTAVLTINGTAINVKRFDFWQNEAKPNAMLGEWSAVIGASGDLFDADRIVYTTPFTESSSGTPALGGARLGSTPASNGAAVIYSPSAQRWTALLDSSSGFYRLFEFSQTGFNRVEGSFWIYAKNTSPAGEGTFYQAFRTASAAFVQNGTGPASTKRALEMDISEHFNARDRALFLALEREGKMRASVDESVVERARFLETLLEEARRAMQ
ncbi:MAG TPA: hypothetical protein VM122_06750 [Usitatibacter sp.]|nr:hypothetical protein [Usitatibacter sp.]